MIDSDAPPFSNVPTNFGTLLNCTFNTFIQRILAGKHQIVDLRDTESSVPMDIASGIPTCSQKHANILTDYIAQIDVNLIKFRHYAHILHDEQAAILKEAQEMDLEM